VKKVHLVEVGSVEDEAQRLVLPEHVQLALVEVAASAKEGLLALAVGAGLAVLRECVEHEVDGVVGRKGRHDRERTAKRQGHVGGEVTLGGRRVWVPETRFSYSGGP
jgi:putative transposase